MPTAAPVAPVDDPRAPLWRITDRRTFTTLREQGRRARRGVVSVTYLSPIGAASTDPPRVAFAISKAAGEAVVRNRIRRRLRSALRELGRSGRLPAGAYLLSARASAAQMPWSELVSDVRGAVEAATR